MFEYPLNNRFTGKVQFACQLDDSFKDESGAVKKGEAVKIAIKSSADLRSADLRSADLSYADLRSADLSYADLRYADLRYADLSSANLSSANLSYADLRSADLRSADLSYADLRYANLSYADLRSADLRYADLRYANLSYADLSSADLSYADLRYADLRYANLSYADLSSAKEDFFAKLLLAKNEAQGLYDFIMRGKIDGSCYEGECACFVGSIAKVCGQEYSELTNGLKPDSSSPTEIWFYGINKGDTPQNNQVSAITAEWMREFMTEHNIIIPEYKLVSSLEKPELFNK